MNVAQLSIANRIVCIDRTVCRGLHVPGPISPVPGAPDWILGAWGYLGRVVSVVDLARMTGWGAVARPVGVIMLVELGRELLAIAADKDLGEHRIVTPDRSDGLFDPIVSDPPTELGGGRTAPPEPPGRSGLAGSSSAELAGSSSTELGGGRTAPPVPPGRSGLAGSSSTADPPLLLEVARLPAEFEAALLRGNRR